MTDAEIRKAVADEIRKIRDAGFEVENARLRLLQLRLQCPHSEKQTWTNNDGDGQFVVERCSVCGLQKDGGLR